MLKNFKVDNLDKFIIENLTKSARTPFVEIARMADVSGALIHQRVQKLEDEDVFKGSAFILNPKGLGYLTCAFIGIQVNLLTPHTHVEVYNKISEIPEITECHHVSGKYSLLVKIHTKNNEHLKNIIIEKIQSIQEITGTETIISLQEGFIRQLKP